MNMRQQTPDNTKIKYIINRLALLNEDFGSFFLEIHA